MPFVHSAATLAGRLVLVATVSLSASGVRAQSEGSGNAAHQGTSARQTGNQGVRVRMPGMANPGRTLPIERQITLPGLEPVQSPTRVTTGSRPLAYNPVTRIRQSGVSLDASGTIGDLTLGVSVNPGLVVTDGTTIYPIGAQSRGYYRYGNSVYYNPGWYYGGGYYWSDRPVDGVMTQRVDPTLRSPPVQVVVVEEPKPLTSIQEAHLWMVHDEPEKAIQAYRDHLDVDDPEDVGAMRALGFALIEANRTSDGVAMIALAYRTDAYLARNAADLDELGIDRWRFQQLLGRALSLAQRTNAGSAHLAAVVLLQAEGKVAGASRVLDRAERAGLAENLVDAFRRELGVPARG